LPRQFQRDPGLAAGGGTHEQDRRRAILR